MKFTIRDILWLTILVASLVAWWLDHRASAGRHETLRRQIEQLNYTVQMERAQHVLRENEIVRDQAAREIQARDEARDVRRAMELLIAPAP